MNFIKQHSSKINMPYLNNVVKYSDENTVAIKTSIYVYIMGLSGGYFGSCAARLSFSTNYTSADITYLTEKEFVHLCTVIEKMYKELDITNVNMTPLYSAILMLNPHHLKDDQVPIVLKILNCMGGLMQGKVQSLFDPVGFEIEEVISF